MQHDRGYWQQHVLAHRRSRLTQSAYCLQHGLHPKTYRTWSRRLEAEGDLESGWVAGVGARPVEGVEELAYPLHGAIPGRGADRAEIVGAVAQRQRYTDEEKQQFVLAALQSGLPIERYARMSGLTPSALHRWKHRFAMHVGLLPPIATSPAFASVTVALPSDRTSPAGDPTTPALKAMVWNSVDIALGNGRRLTVDVRVDAVALRRLLAILEAPA